MSDRPAPDADDGVGSYSVEVSSPKPQTASRFAATPLLIVYFFVAVIAIGTGLLMLPFTQTSGGATPFMSALFTATSAITVTGLVVQDTATYWTRAGQIIILGLIYLGGLGFMTIATFLLILIGQRMSLTHRLLMRENLMIDQFGNLVRLTVGVVLIATGIQMLGFIALLVYFYLFLYPAGEAVWQAAFHSVSAFNNAGFLAFREEGGLLAFRTDKVALGIVGTLIFIGAISYLVIIDLARLARVRRFSRLTLNTKIVLTATAALTLVGFAGFFALEYGNPATIGGLSLGDKLAAAAFQAVSLRTAGFSVADLAAARDATNLLSAALMFVGGAAASVAGGIKVNTLAVVAISMVALIKGRNQAAAFGREIPRSQVQRASTILMASLLFMLGAVLLLSVAEPEFGALSIIFETASAFGTVGLSMGITPHLSDFGQALIVASMIIGKLGPLTIGLTMAQRPDRDAYRYAQERVTIG